MPIIEVRNVVKKYGEITAVAGLDLDVNEGECFGERRELF
jgi:ABC-type multidrug transport system ATPase subunit